MEKMFKMQTLKGRRNDKFDLVVISVFFLLYLMLPDYFAIEINEALPLLMVSRILIIILFIYVITRYKIDWKVKTIPLAIGIYFILLLFVNVMHFPDAFTDSLKSISSILCEELLLIILLAYTLDTKEKIQLAIKWMVYASAIIVVLGALESFTGINIFMYLDSVQREMLQSEYIRLGFQRAAGPFGHSVYYGAYCVLMLPFSLYLFKKTKKLKYYFIALLNVIGVFLSMARGSILVLAVLFMLLIIKHGFKFSRRSWILIISTVICGLFFVLIIPVIRETFFDLIKSTINGMIGHSSSADNFGENGANALASRLEQFSGIIWQYKQGVLPFGFGSDCHARGLVYYFHEGCWIQSGTFDVGYVAYMMEYGIIGVLGYISLFVYLFIFTFRRAEGYMKNLNCPIMLFYIVYYVSLWTISGMNSFFWLVTGIVFASLRQYPTIFTKKLCIFKYRVLYLNEYTVMVKE